MALNNARLIPLRILYTINSSPQYILARSNKPAVVSPIPRRPPPNSYYHHAPAPAPTPDPVPPEEHYASASLKICLDTICCSSPELVQDPSRDFSVYVLDPLESQSTPAPVHIPRNAPSGTPTATAPETQAPPDQHPRGVAVGLGLMSWALLADQDDGVAVTGTLITLAHGQEALQVIFALRETAPMRRAALSSTVKSWGLPPPPSNRTRVHASKHHHASRHVIPASSPFQPSNASQTIYSKRRASEASPVPTTSQYLDSHSVYIGPPKRPVGRPETGRGKTRMGKNSPPERPSHAEPSLADLLSAISASGQNAALLSALSTIDASTAPDPMLVDALKQLLTAAPQDDDIVLLDKENVNPTAFRRRSERDDGKTPPAPSVSPSTVARKRTLSEFMDERGREGHRRARSPTRAQTSPARPVTEHAGTSPVRSRKRFEVPEWAKTDSAMRPRLSKGAEERGASVVKEGKREKEKGKVRKGRGRRWRAERAATPTPASTSTDASEGESLRSAPAQVGTPVAAAARLPVFASSISVAPFLTSPTRAPPRTPRTPPRTPRTPPRRRVVGDDEDPLPSLFTPLGVFGSPLFTPGLLSSSPARSGDPELDAEGEEAEVPPSSLPVASSDFNVEHWAGLPPSSPPPPSSPLVSAEVDVPLDEQSVPGFDAPLDDLSSLFCVPAGSTDVPEFDFTEFWESVRPLVEGEQGGSEGVDHVKLAEEVQALFSGCLM